MFVEYMSTIWWCIGELKINNTMLIDNENSGETCPMYVSTRATLRTKIPTLL